MTTTTHKHLTEVNSINIDIFRTFLAQWVIIGHLGPVLFSLPLVPGRLAVWCFFILSGYLNAKSFQRRLVFGYSETIKGYYLSRIKRIYPLLVFSCIVVSIFLGTINIKDWYVLFPYQYSYREMLSNGVLWTLVIEIQLYLITPLLFMLAFKFKDINCISKSALGIGLVFAIPLINISLTGNKDLIDDRTMMGNIGFYLFGMMLFLREDDGIKFDDKFYRYFCILIVLIGVFFLAQYNFVSQGIQFTMGPFISFLISLLLIFSMKPVISSAHSVFRFLGFYTYEIYVMHGLMIFVSHQLNANSISSTIIFWWLLPILLVMIFDVTYKKKYKQLFNS